MNPVPTIGIDIGGSSVKAAILGANPACSQSSRYDHPSRERLAAAIREAVVSLGVRPNSTTGVGLCVPGRRNAENSAVELALNIPALEGWAFEDLVRDTIGEEASLYAVLTDAEAATLDAARAHPKSKRVLGISIGTGVGACLLEDGEPVRIGSHGIGHLGQLEVRDSGDTLESVVGISVMRDRFGERIKRNLPALDASDPVIVALSRAIRTCLVIYQPDVILLMGGIGLSLEPSMAELKAAVSASLSEVVRPGWRIEVGTSLHHAAMGAASAAETL